MTIKKSIIMFTILLALSAGIFLFINPYEVAPIVFVPITAVLYLFFVSCINLLYVLFIGVGHTKKRLTFAAIMACTPTILFALLTLSRITLFDVLLAIALPAAIAWYTAKNYTEN